MWFSGDGSAIDSEVDPPDHTEAMNAGQTAYLFWTSGANLDGAPMATVVKARRGSYDSDKTEEATATASAVGPMRVEAGLFFGKSHAMEYSGETEPSDTFVIDAGTNTRIIYSAGSSALYVGSVLIWRMLYDGTKPDESWVFFPTELGLVHDESSFGAGNGDLVEVVSSTELYVVTKQSDSDNGVRRLKIDLSANEISFGALWSNQDIGEFSSTDLVHGGYDETRFQFFDRASQSFLTLALIDSAGVFKLLSGFDHTKPQAQIVGLTI